MTLFNNKKQQFCLTLSNGKRMLSFWIAADKLKRLLEFRVEPAHFAFVNNTHTVNKINNITYDQIRVYIIMTCAETEPRTVLLQRTYLSSTILNQKSHLNLILY